MEKLSRRQAVVLLVAFLVLGCGVGVFVGSRLPRSPSVTAPTGTGEPVIIDTEETTPSTINVYVAGEVLHPAVYQLAEGAIVRDAVEAAGGATNNADLIAVNLAARLEDGEQVTVPSLAADGSSASLGGGQSAGTTSTRVSINRGTLAELDTLPGIGPSKAQAIIDYRALHGPFKRLEDLQNVKGIGSKTFEQLKPLITL
ncbi:MAG: helix-hairpin-helix domain-containing protein [Candidatus Cryosericum sp.]|nr:helix-hairpin-helix domain-containing protein [Candidatus Cryosericum sp.]HPS69388.1 helix-hairpin-helix domain-containing protein [Candidatus Cryosericum sp.]